MSDNTIDDQSSELQTKHPFKLIGVGVFLWLCARSLSKIVKTAVVDLGLVNEMDIYLTYWLKFLITALSVIFFVIVIIVRFQRAYFISAKIITRFFYQMIWLYVSIILIEILYRYYFSYWVTDEYSEMHILYMRTLYEPSAVYTFLDLGLDTGLTIFCGIYLFRRDRIIQKKAKHV